VFFALKNGKIKLNKMKKADLTSKIFGLEVFSKRRSELLKEITAYLEKPRETLIIFTPNPEQVVLAQSNPLFKTILTQADILIPDGIGLVWASKLLASATGKTPLAERISGVDLVSDLLEYANRHQLSVLILGGREYEGLRYNGQPIQRATAESDLYWLEGYRDIKNPTDREEQYIAKVISNYRPDMVFVALGAPNQEQWVITHRQLLEENGVSLVMAVGGAFDFLLRKVQRAPEWMRNYGLEWLYRLVHEPWRWKRQLRIPIFLFLVMIEFLTATFTTKKEQAG
jgi:N-acetylglucosaminyldiphosphoundecaprenol N-acetyl-beta-D-mannosaminyltransferase